MCAISFTQKRQRRNPLHTKLLPVFTGLTPQRWSSKQESCMILPKMHVFLHEFSILILWLCIYTREYEFFACIYVYNNNIMVDKSKIYEVSCDEQLKLDTWILMISKWKKKWAFNRCSTIFLSIWSFDSGEKRGIFWWTQNLKVFSLVSSSLSFIGLNKLALYLFNILI